MTPDQVTQALTLLQNAPAQVLLAIALYLVWKTLVTLIDRAFSMIEGWTALAIKIVENAQPRQPIALLPAPGHDQVKHDQT